MRSVLDRYLVKQASDAELSYSLQGQLVLTSNGNLNLTVPNNLARGAFDALNEVGIEIPKGDKFNSHITVASREELAGIGGGDKISERGHSFGYTLGPLRSAEPDGWAEMSRVWFIVVKSPELEKLRKSYGLPATPKHPFHITVAVRRRGVTRPGEVVKHSSILGDPAGYDPENTSDCVVGQIKYANEDGAPYRERAEVFAMSPEGKVYGGIWDNDKSFAVPGGGIDPGEEIPQAGAREFMEETGLQVNNPRLLPVTPVTYDWSPEQIARLPEHKRTFRGSRSHFVLADLPSIDRTGSGRLDHWGATDKRLYDLAEALAAMEGKQPMSPEVFAARKQVLQHLLAQRGQKAASPASDLLAAEKQVNTSPTEAQQEAGNYQKGHFKWNGLDISIENPKGSTRSGTSKSGKKWSTKMKHSYGYIRTPR